MNLLRPQQVAEKLLTTEGTLAKWRLRGCGPKFIRLGLRTVGYRPEDLDEWIGERVHTSTSGGGKGGRKKKTTEPGMPLGQ